MLGDNKFDSSSTTRSTGPGPLAAGVPVEVEVPVVPAAECFGGAEIF